MKLTKIDLERLACTFRNNPVAAPILSHTDTWNAIEKIGGRAAILYGMFLATPPRSRWKKQYFKADIATAIDLAAIYWDRLHK